MEGKREDGEKWDKGRGRRESKREMERGGETPVAIHFEGVDLGEHVTDPENNLKSSCTFLHVLILLHFCLKRQQISVVFLGSSFQSKE